MYNITAIVPPPRKMAENVRMSSGNQDAIVNEFIIGFTFT
jgi:hypothetical protein